MLLSLLPLNGAALSVLCPSLLLHRCCWASLCMSLSRYDVLTLLAHKPCWSSAGCFMTIVCVRCSSYGLCWMICKQVAQLLHCYMSESDVHEWLVHVACAAEKADLASPAVIPMLQGWTKACAALRPPGIAPSSSGARQVAAPAAHLAFLSLHFYSAN